MATYAHREIVTRRVEYTVPAAEPWGACYVELYKAIDAAERDYRDRRSLPDNVSLADDTLRVFPRDQEIVISFTIEETA